MSRTYGYSPENCIVPDHKSREFRMPNLPSHIEGIPLAIGPGGSLCSCCAPAPGSKDRAKTVRAARRKAKQKAIRESLELLDD